MAAFGEDSKNYGLTERDIRSAAAFPIVTSRLTISETSPVNLHISVQVAVLDNIGCVASLIVSVRAFQIADLDATDLSKLVQIRLWEVGGMSWGPQNTFPSRIRQEIEDMTKEFVVDWTLDQQ